MQHERILQILSCVNEDRFFKKHILIAQFRSHEVPAEAKLTLVTEVRMAVIFAGSRHDAEQDGKQITFFF